MNPVLLDIPESFDTERLTIRAPRFGDGAALREAVIESQEHLRPWMPWARTIPTPEAEEELVRRGRARFLLREDLWLFIWLKDSEMYVGGTGLHRIKWDVPCFEIGYWVRKRFEGQGFITETVRELTRFAFDTLNAERVEIRCDTLNLRSAAVAVRAGYTLEGILRRDGRTPDGDLRDTKLYSMIRAEWIVPR